MDKILKILCCKGDTTDEDTGRYGILNDNYNYAEEEFYVENPDLDETDDGRNTPNLARSKKEQEQDMLETILEQTQQNIIDVGHSEQILLQTTEAEAREAKYLAAVLKNDLKFKATPSLYHDGPDHGDKRLPKYSNIVPHSSDLDNLRKNIQDTTRGIGERETIFLEEIPEVKKIGRTQEPSRAFMRQLTRQAKEIHDAVNGVQVESRGDLVVFMEF